MLSLFFFNDTATTEIYTLSLHDAHPISRYRVAAPREGRARSAYDRAHLAEWRYRRSPHADGLDRKSTRLNSSHLGISYAVFCLKKKKHKDTQRLSCMHKMNSNIPSRCYE